MTSQEILLQDGIRAARAGQREQARNLLMQVVQADERNEAAWLWLSGVVDDPEDVRICLQNVLDINPKNEKAQKGIAWLNAHHPVAVSAAPQPVTNETIALNQSAAAMGETIQLSDPQAAAVASAPARKVYTVDDIEIPAGMLPDVDNPCPYCGVATRLGDKKCPQCGNSLMITSNEGRKRSWATVVLTVFASISAFFAILMLGLLGFLAVVGLSSGTMNSREESTTLGMIMGFLLYTVFIIAQARGLWKMKIWAYIVHLLFIALYIFQTISGAALTKPAMDELLQQLPPSDHGVIQIIVGAGLFLSFAILAVQIFVTVVAWKDFFGGKVRMITDVPTRSDEEHYNMGLAYKDRGMWYIATREWEMAAAKRPSDPNYRRILGLAYAQIKQYGRALRELREAARLRVNDQQLRDDIAYVENIALKELNSQNRI